MPIALSTIVSRSLCPPFTSNVGSISVPFTESPFPFILISAIPPFTLPHLPLLASANSLSSSLPGAISFLNPDPVYDVGIPPDVGPTGEYDGDRRSRDPDDALSNDIDAFRIESAVAPTSPGACDDEVDGSTG